MDFASKMPSYAQIQYFFQLDLGDAGELSLVMVKFYRRVDNDLLDASSATLFTAELRDELQVIPHEFLISVVTAPPCPTSLGREDRAGYVFIAEKMGVEVAWLDADDERRDDEERQDDDDGFGDQPDRVDFQ